MYSVQSYVQRPVPCTVSSLCHVRLRQWSDAALLTRHTQSVQASTGVTGLPLQTCYPMQGHDSTKRNEHESHPLWQTRRWQGRQHEEERANLKAAHCGKLNIGKGDSVKRNRQT